jgi:hypothetical protein
MMQHGLTWLRSITKHKSGKLCLLIIYKQESRVDLMYLQRYASEVRRSISKRADYFIHIDADRKLSDYSVNVLYNA